MKGRRVPINNDLKKKLTVQPFLPGSPIVINYTLYKITNNFMYIPKYFSSEGELIENEINYKVIQINTEPRDYQKNIIHLIHFN